MARVNVFEDANLLQGNSAEFCSASVSTIELKLLSLSSGKDFD